MSNEHQKNKHSRRIHNTEKIIKSRLKLTKRLGIADSRHAQGGRFAKQHPLDCGNPGCPMCSNPRKIWKQKTIKELSDSQDIIQEE